MKTPTDDVDWWLSMSAQYDEDIYENPFFVALQTHFSDILKKTAQNGWIVRADSIIIIIYYEYRLLEESVWCHC